MMSSLLYISRHFDNTHRNYFMCSSSPITRPGADTPPATKRALFNNQNSIIITIILICTIGFVYASVHIAQPDEWMLVIKVISQRHRSLMPPTKHCHATQDGKMHKAGVGMRHFALPGEQVVTFPSSLQKVPFKAQQVTREMQGVEVQGFAIWGVYRLGDGPFKAYRNLDGLTPAGIKKTNSNLEDMAESILRAQVANMTISDVLTQRKGMRAAVTGSMMEVVKGWGIWLETLEVTDVKILSKTLFHNMQTQFREDTRLAAEKLALKVSEDIQLAKVQTDLRVAKADAEARKHRAVHALQQQVREHEEKEAAEAKNHALQLERQKRNHVLAMQKQKEEGTRREAALATEMALKLQRAQTEAKIRELVLQTEKSMDATNMEVARWKAMKEIYAGLPLKEFKVINVAGAGGGEGSQNGTLAGGLLLPGLAASMMPN